MFVQAGLSTAEAAFRGSVQLACTPTSAASVFPQIVYVDFHLTTEKQGTMHSCRHPDNQTLFLEMHATVKIVSLRFFVCWPQSATICLCLRDFEALYLATDLSAF